VRPAPAIGTAFVLVVGLWVALGFILAGLWWLVTLGWGWWPW
jgi:hypothetical protein